MKKFIAYFDLLGFEQFIERNNIEDQQKALDNIFHILEYNIANGKVQFTNQGVFPDTSLAKINCLNFSDTFVFWTKDASENSLINLLKVVHVFNLKMIINVFPIRGAITYGEILHASSNEVGDNKTIYNVNSVYGKGIIEAYRKAESQNWAGTVIDNKLIDELICRKIDVDTLLKPFAKKYKVPYKECVKQNNEEFVLCLKKEEINEVCFINDKSAIENNFAEYNKDISSSDVQYKITKTIDFLKSFKV